MRTCKSCGQSWDQSNPFMPISPACPYCGSTRYLDSDDNPYLPAGSQLETKELPDSLRSWYARIKKVEKRD